MGAPQLDTRYVIESIDDLAKKFLHHAQDLEKGGVYNLARIWRTAYRKTSELADDLRQDLYAAD